MLALVLHDLRSALNVGAIFRTADACLAGRQAAGVGKIFLTGYTPAPRDRFGRLNRSIAKTALGAEQNVVWEKVEDISSLFYNLKTKTYKLIALEQSPRAVDYRQIKLSGDTAIIVGNEVTGLPEEILARCDAIAEIPMRGKKESLNVAVAAGVALFRWLE